MKMSEQMIDSKRLPIGERSALGKSQRMLASPFAFFRGSAIIMASDLASTPVSGLDVILCGDAHHIHTHILKIPQKYPSFAMRWV